MRGGSAQGRSGWAGWETPARRFRDQRDEACAESIRRASGAGESERPIVVRKRGNARGAKGSWQERCGLKENRG